MKSASGERQKLPQSLTKDIFKATRAREGTRCRYRSNSQCVECSKGWRRRYAKTVRKDKTGIRHITEQLRARLRAALHGNFKSGSAVRDLGCTIGEFKDYVEMIFMPGMTWDNWSTDGWHLDHVLPLASFDLTDRTQFLKAMHWTNYQPLWVEDHKTKTGRERRYHGL